MEDGEIKRAANQWEKFQACYIGTARSYLRVSLNKQGVLLLNTCAMQRMGFPEVVTLHYDHANSLIGIKRGDTGDNDSLYISKRPDRGYGKIGAKAFCRYFGLMRSSTRIFYPEIDADGMLTLDLKRAQEFRRRNAAGNG
jgi:hypothetical protein